MHIKIPTIKGQLEGEIEIPENSAGLVIFAHGSGSSRFSPRNQFVASHLQQNLMGTLLIDLLTPNEEAVDQYSREHRFNIDLLTRRLLEISKWLGQHTNYAHLKQAYFGASTGAAAALMAAAQQGNALSAVVSRGGRPDLALPVLKEVKAPTLLIVGGHDEIVIELNKQAYAALTCEKSFKIIPGATHLFEEEGTLEAAAAAAAMWFKGHFSSS